MIPVLKTAFCGCSVRTGSKVIGWVITVLGIIQFIVVAAVIGTLAVNVSSTDDEQVGRKVIKMLKEFDDPELQELLIGITDTSEPEQLGVVGRQLKVQLKGIFTMVLLIFLVVFLLQMLFSALLLIGVYKNKSDYVGFYLFISILGLVGYFPFIFNTHIPFDLKISTVIGCLIHLYFTWVIYSFYKELLRPRPNNPAYAMDVLLPGQ